MGENFPLSPRQQQRELEDIHPAKRGKRGGPLFPLSARRKLVHSHEVQSRNINRRFWPKKKPSFFLHLLARRIKHALLGNSYCVAGTFRAGHYWKRALRYISLNVPYAPYSNCLQSTRTSVIICTLSLAPSAAAGTKQRDNTFPSSKITRQ